MRSSYVFALLCTVAVLAIGIHAYPSGAPPTACEDMVPQHFDPAQTNSSPYTGSMESLGGNRYSIKLMADSTTFSGMFIQVRDLDENIIGAFEPPEDENVKLIDCSGGTMNAATHNSNAAKTSVDVVWDGTGSTIENIAVYYTTCYNSSTFWVKEALLVDLLHL